MGPSFLSLPPRSTKPRRAGLTHVLDRGLPVSATTEILESVGEHVDVWKFGWGTAYVDRGLDRKLAVLKDHEVASCLGGTLLEIAWSQGRAEQCLEWARRSGFDAVEVSRGVADMPLDAKRELVKSAAETFVVLAETGVKDAAVVLSSRQWRDEIAEDLAAGATWIIAEGRESGTVGIYDSAGVPKPDIIDAAVDAAGLDRVLFEAPRKDQQAWLISRFGPDVNLGNIAPAEVLPLTTLRLGLRADTAPLSLGRPL
ncbi:phosphosulfolactate synthase [Asanoa hainanensis]|uniref:Phosphosulfolactate synthase n=1 Tax=Asanoa hainanensis TaxID=560556 RepID=A0A239GTC8_9ACTN|nr:phosphosulfolactate synthase [Asanoa hainanensis]SNS71324.1 phosphosulfolactate synthase [Asanoa hainanensis]